MSRSGYTEDGDGDLNLYRANVDRATVGKRGQSMFRDLLAALDDMPSKRLIANEIVQQTGEVCALGALGKARGVKNLDKIDPEDAYYVAEEFNIAECLAREVVYMNDEGARSFDMLACSLCDGHGVLNYFHSQRPGPFKKDCQRCWGYGQMKQWRSETPEERFVRVRAWVASQIVSVPA